MTAELRKSILDDAAECVCKARVAVYGETDGHFAAIAAIANVTLASKLSAPLDANDVAMFMCGVKLARLATSPQHRDSWVDLAGYAACGGSFTAAAAAAGPPQA